MDRETLIAMFEERIRECQAGCDRCIKKAKWSLNQRARWSLYISSIYLLCCGHDLLQSRYGWCVLDSSCGLIFTAFIWFCWRYTIRSWRQLKKDYARQRDLYKVLLEKMTQEF